MGRGLSRREDGALVVKAARPRALAAAAIGVGLTAFAILAILRAGAGFWPILLLILGIAAVASPLLLALAPPRLVIADGGVELWGASHGWDEVVDVAVSSGPDAVLPHLRGHTIQFLLDPQRLVPVPLHGAPVDTVIEEIERRSGLKVRQGDLVDEALTRAADPSSRRRRHGE